MTISMILLAAVASGITHWTVPATGEKMYLPDADPADGVKEAPVTIVMAKEEYEPGSFILKADRDYKDKLSFELGEFKNAEGKLFPKEELDLKVVKVWYQNGNAWLSYFQDVKLRLCPELLLNDEDLIRVDEKEVSNYARLTEKDGTTSEFWLTPPRLMNFRCTEIRQGYHRDQDPFLCMKENFKDAKTFQGARLEKNRCKQFFLTAHATKATPAGLYRGEIKVKSEKGKGDELYSIPVAIRVLDFVLPEPRTYFDLEKEFLTLFCEYSNEKYIATMNGGDEALAHRQMAAIMKNHIRHGYKIPSGCYRRHWKKELEEMGADLRFGFGGGCKFADASEVRCDVRRQNRLNDETLGYHKGVMVGWGDEYGLATLRKIRYMIKEYHDAGYIFPINSRYGYDAGANIADVFWPPFRPDQETADLTFKFNQLGKGRWFGWYSNQHVGVENPAFTRRQYGFGPYRAGLSLNFNYAHHYNGWNDISNTLYKPMNLCYGCGDGCINTIAYEGVREGLDDIRYATYLKQLAEPLAVSDNTDARYTARLALKLLADADGDNMDLTTLRLEMIEWIGKLRRFAK